MSARSTQYCGPNKRRRAPRAVGSTSVWVSALNASLCDSRDGQGKRTWAEDSRLLNGVNIKEVEDTINLVQNQAGGALLYL